MNQQIKMLLGLLLVVVIVLGLGFLLFKNFNTVPSSQPADQSVLVRADSFQTNPGAKVTVVEFADFQCPACAQALPAVDQILAKYQDNKDFNFVFRQFPLNSLHPYAQLAAEASEAAGAQGKFWEMYQEIYKNQPAWAASETMPTAMFVSFAQKLGLDVNKFQTDLTNHTFAARVKTDVDDGNSALVDATPTFFVNGQRFVGIPSSDMTAAIVAALK
jgi:protein-disulfide isomerase